MGTRNTLNGSSVWHDIWYYISIYIIYIVYQPTISRIMIPHEIPWSSWLIISTIGIIYHILPWYNPHITDMIQMEDIHFRNPMEISPGLASGWCSWRRGISERPGDWCQGRFVLWRWPTSHGVKKISLTSDFDGEKPCCLEWILGFNHVSG